MNVGFPKSAMGLWMTRMRFEDKRVSIRVNVAQTVYICQLGLGLICEWRRNGVAKVLRRAKLTALTEKCVLDQRRRVAACFTPWRSLPPNESELPKRAQDDMSVVSVVHVAVTLSAGFNATRALVIF
jgi:hypothetical protein